MKNLNKFFTKIAMVAVMLGAAVSLTSCESEETVIDGVYYSMGIDSFSSNNPSFVAYMVTVENTFKKELGVDSSTFKLDGTIEECDAEVKAGCARAEASLNNTGIEDSKFVYIISNRNTDKVVYTYTYNSKE